MKTKRKSSFIKYTLSALFICFTISCSKPEPPKEEKKNGTKEMVQLLEKIHSQIDPRKVNYFSNAVRALGFKSIMDGNGNIGQKLNAAVRYGYELLHAGKTLDAISELEKLLVQFEKNGVGGKNLYNTQRLLALAYMRLGEQNNCVGKKNPDSCIIPIQGAGIYTARSGSETAIKIYSTMLEQNPEDLESIWMLNITYMTLGEYPNKVPKKWLIPSTSFNSDFDLPVFPNISNELGINTVGLSGGACTEDFNNDGFVDIVASSWGVNDQIKIFLNNGDGTFTDQSSKLGLTEAIYTMGCNYGDIDNDGYSDFYLGTGAPSFTSLVPNKLYRNNKAESFQDVTTTTRVGHIQKGHGVAFADFDNDGDQDIFHVLGGAFEGDLYQDVFFENPIGNQKNWIVINLVGKTSNRLAIGARVRIIAVDKNQKEQIIHRVVSTGGSFGSSSLQLELGVGNANTIKEVEIQWPNAAQTKDRYTNLSINQFFELREGEKEVKVLEREKIQLGKSNLK